MTSLNYYILDVFTTEPYKGNPLSVVWCEHDLELHQYYAIAREFGYSETSFVNYSSADKAFRVRSFTPGDFEVAGAGHNLLGAVCLAVLKEWDIFREQGDRRWVIMKAEKIPLQVTMEKGRSFIALKQRPAVVAGTVPAEIIAKAVGLDPAALTLLDWEPAVVSTEVAHLMVPVRTSDFLKQAVPNKTLLKQASERYGFEGCYLFTTDKKEGHHLAETRFFNPGIGIDEDAATGTAAGPLAGYLRQLQFISPDQEYEILQGVQVGHPSTIRVRVSAEGVWVSGSSVIVMEGTLVI